MKDTMETTKPLYRIPFSLTLVALGVLVSSTGCSLAANLLNAYSGNMIPPAFDGLSERRVAVVCVADSTAYGPSVVTNQLALSVDQLLRANVPDIEIVSQNEIDDWRDNNEWNGIDFSPLGKGVDAEMVVLVDIGSFRIHDGKTMYRGRADVGVAVYDMTAVDGDQEVFRKSRVEQTFPENGPLATTDTTDARFRNQFVRYLAHQVAKNFFAYDFKEDFALDSMTLAK